MQYKKIFFTTIIILIGAFAFAQIKQVDSLLKLLDATTEDSNRLRLNRRLGDFYMDNNSTKAIQYFETAVSYAEKLQRPLGIANNNYSIGYCYLLKGDYDKSLEYYLKSVRIYESLKDSFRLTNAFMSIANVYSNNKNFTKTNEYHNKAQLIIEKMKDSSQLCAILDSRGTVYDQQGKFDTALLYLFRSKKIAEALNDNFSIVNSLSNIGLTYKHINKTALALQYFDSALKMNSKEGEQLDRLSIFYNNIAATHSQAGNFVKAKDAFDKSISYSKASGSLPVEMENYRNLADMYEKAGDYKQQIFYQKKYYNLKDSLYTTDSKNQLTQLEADYNIEKKNNEIAKKETEVTKGKNQRNLFITLAGGMLLLLGGLGFFYGRIKNKNNLLGEQNILINKQKDELQKLNGVKDRLFSIISHDLRNPLVTLRSYLNLSDNPSIADDKKIAYKKQTSQAVSQTTDLLDNLLVWANMQIKNTNASISPIDLTEIVLDAIDDVQAQATQKNIIIKKNITIENVISDKNILTISLRNLLTNAIKFSPENTTIFINGYEENGKIIIAVKDNGVGMTANQIENVYSNETDSSQGTQGEKGSGLGLFLVKELLAKANASLTIKSEVNKGSEFSIVLG
jgi:signal transduction histidine kinase